MKSHSYERLSPQSNFFFIYFYFYLYQFVVFNCYGLNKRKRNRWEFINIYEGNRINNRIEIRLIEIRKMNKMVTSKTQQLFIPLACLRRSSYRSLLRFPFVQNSHAHCDCTTGQATSIQRSRYNVRFIPILCSSTTDLLSLYELRLIGIKIYWKTIPRRMGRIECQPNASII